MYICIYAKSVKLYQTLRTRNPPCPIFYALQGNPRPLRRRFRFDQQQKDEGVWFTLTTSVFFFSKRSIKVRTWLTIKKKSLRLKAQILLFSLQTGVSSHTYLTKVTKSRQLYLSESGSGDIWNADCRAQREHWSDGLRPSPQPSLDLTIDRIFPRDLL